MRSIACDDPLASEVINDCRAGSYEDQREILQQGKKTGRFERGTGTVTETGDVGMKGWEATPNMKFDAEYKGRITGDRV